jgi:hypothetical protein
LYSVKEIVDCEEEVDAIQDLDDIDDLGFFLEDDFNFHLGLINHDDICLILDMGSLKSTVLDPRLLSDLQPIEKKMKTYPGLIEITHIGSMQFSKYKIYPVYFAPSGRCNLVLMSQLKDHGFVMFHKNKLIIACMGSTY